VSVNHSSAYQKSLASNHGAQLALALEEGRGKDDAPFDPFSQFLSMMGSEQEGDAKLEDVQDAEFEELDEEMNAEEEISAEMLPKYTTTGAIHRPLSERKALRAGYPSGGKFAVIHLEGFQHKVTQDDLLVVNKLKPVAKWSVGSTHTLSDDDILLVADQNETLVGLPGVKGAQVDVMVEEITRDKTVIVFKKRRRKNSRRKNGFRRQVTFLRVLGVRFPGEGVGDVERVAA
jgi:large subunit ribosomal protein L21